LEILFKLKNVLSSYAKYLIHAGPFFETQTVKSLLLLWKLRMQLLVNQFKHFSRSHLRIE